MWYVSCCSAAVIFIIIMSHLAFAVCLSMLQQAPCLAVQKLLLGAPTFFRPSRWPTLAIRQKPTVLSALNICTTALMALLCLAIYCFFMSLYKCGKLCLLPPILLASAWMPAFCCTAAHTKLLRTFLLMDFCDCRHVPKCITISSPHKAEVTEALIAINHVGSTRFWWRFRCRSAFTRPFHDTAMDAY